MPGIVTSSVGSTLSLKLRRLFNKELSRDRQFDDEKRSSPATQWMQIARSATKMDGCSSTGIVLTGQHIVGATVASSKGLRWLVKSTLVGGTTKSTFIYNFRDHGMGTVLYALAQVQASKTGWLGTSSRSPGQLCTQVLSGATVWVGQYGHATTPGSLTPSSGKGLITLAVLGY